MTSLSTNGGYNDWNARQLRWKSGTFLILCLFIPVLWSMLFSLASAVISPGILEVRGQRQVVEHLTGGRILEIHVQNGDEVHAGQELVKLDDGELQPELDIVLGQWYEIRARQARLEAVRDGSGTIAFDRELADSKLDSVELLMSAQQVQFHQGLELLATAEEQIRQQIRAFQAVLKAHEEQIRIISDDLTAKQSLLLRELIERPVVANVERELSKERGEKGQVEATIAELSLELNRLYAMERDKAIAELRELEPDMITLRQKRRQLTDRINKLQLRSPVDGIVYGSTVYTAGGVIGAGEALMYIVPKDAPLIIKARVTPTDIDQVHEGLDVKLRFPGFNQRTTPEVDGRVFNVSADAYTDPHSGVQYYEVQIELDEAAVDALGSVKLLPGMPVEAHIQTGERAALSYLVKPLTDYFARAWRQA